MNSWLHAVSSANKFGGTPEEHLPIHEWLDSSKTVIADVRHRSMYHHSKGIWDAQLIFGRTITVQVNGKDKRIPVRLIAELHVEQDLGWIPSPKDYIDGMIVKKWMGGKQRKRVSASVLGLTEEKQ